jgi:hypothetical protein
MPFGDGTYSREDPDTTKSKCGGESHYKIPYTPKVNQKNNVSSTLLKKIEKNMITKEREKENNIKKGEGALSSS